MQIKQCLTLLSYTFLYTVGLKLSRNITHWSLQRPRPQTFPGVKGGASRRRRSAHCQPVPTSFLPGGGQVTPGRREGRREDPVTRTSCAVGRLARSVQMAVLPHLSTEPLLVPSRSVCERHRMPILNFTWLLTAHTKVISRSIKGLGVEGRVGAFRRKYRSASCIGKGFFQR